MNPEDILLDKLREFYNLLQDEGLTTSDAEEAVCLFDDLDNHIISGGQLPREWQR